MLLNFTLWTKSNFLEVKSTSDDKQEELMKTSIYVIVLVIIKFCNKILAGIFTFCKFVRDQNLFIPNVVRGKKILFRS